MRRLHEQVRDFMHEAGQAWSRIPDFPSVETIDLGLKLIGEEWEELQDAVADVPVPVNTPIPPEEKRKIMAAVADAIGDLLYVVTWNGLAWGFPMPEIMEEIQRANMAKFGPGSWKDETGKVRKPPDWQPPNIEQFMERTGPEFSAESQELIDTLKKIKEEHNG
jgi:predicted HAD superfamily Cof-like phosphohydrolase